MLGMTLLFDDFRNAEVFDSPNGTTVAMIVAPCGMPDYLAQKVLAANSDAGSVRYVVLILKLMRHRVGDDVDA